MRLSLTHKNSSNVREDLVRLWKDVFGDSEEYIRLILPYLPFFDCYAVVEEGTVVSAFYLLPCEIKKGEKIYKGRYLYAAATDKSSRKMGYMGSLINEAINELKSEIDFISLVPANEGLYTYYARFGFESVMYNYVTKLKCTGEKDTLKNSEVCGAQEINLLRKEKFDRVHLFSDESMKYALSCYGFFGSAFYKKKDSAVLFVKDESRVYEGVFNVDEKEVYLSLLRDNYKGEISVVSPYALNESSIKEKCGMICAFNDELKDEMDIYMNHTLM